MSGSRSELDIGYVIGGYRLDGLISRGGMGMVYRATNIALDRTYAVKVIAPELAGNDEFRRRFMREVQLAASLNHPNVVTIHYAAEQEGRLFLAMDLVEGPDLRGVIMSSGALEPDRAVRLLTQITSALDAAHRKGLVHRDVKPANVLIGQKGGEEHGYLTDFGLAKRFDNASALTVKGVSVGTVDYMAPEQITGDPVDARTDVYGLGCVFFQMLTGKVPYQRDHSVAKLFAHVHDAPPSLEGPAAASHPTLGPVIAKAMAKSPEDRYASAGDFARDAAAALQGARFTGPPTIVGTGEARPSTPPAPATQPAAPQPPPPVAPPPATVPREPEPARAAPVAAAAPPPQAPAGAAGAGGAFRRYRWPIVTGLVVVVAAVVAVVALSGGSSSAPSGEPFSTALKPVPTNHVTGSGTAEVRLNGDVATVTVTASGLLNGAPHLLHIHAGGAGLCPNASAARLHNGHLSISTSDAGRFYGPPVVALTTVGDTSRRSIIDFTRFPTGANIHYSRTITLTPDVVTHIRSGNAVVIVHGIDYNGNGVYDASLGQSDLSNRLTEESTDPALCGPLAAAKTASLPPRSGTVYTAVLVVDRAAAGRESTFVCPLELAAA